MWRHTPSGGLVGAILHGRGAYVLFHGKPIRAQAWQAGYSLEDQLGLGRPSAGHRLPRRGQRRRYPVDPYASRAAARGVLGQGPV